MFNKVAQLFKSKPSPEAEFLTEHQIQFDPQHGYIVDGLVLNEALSERLEYLPTQRFSPVFNCFRLSWELSCWNMYIAFRSNQHAAYTNTSISIHYVNFS